MGTGNGKMAWAAWHGPAAGGRGTGMVGIWAWNRPVEEESRGRTQHQPLVILLKSASKITFILTKLKYIL